MNATNETADRDSLVKALESTWHERAVDVQRFGLKYDTTAIHPVATGWVVPVASGVGTGSAYELVKMISSLQELAEQKSHLSISLFLDPFAKAS